MLAAKIVTITTPSQLYSRTVPSIVSIKSIVHTLDMFSYPNTKERTAGIGTGFIVVDKSSKASNKTKFYVVTNKHVIENADKIMLHFNDGTETEAQIVDGDRRKDIALLTFDTSALAVGAPPLQFCEAPAFVGESVATIGNPFGLEYALSTGVISGVGRSVEGQPPIVNMLQTDVAMNPGNSGGPLLDMAVGCVVGMSTATMGPGVGLAIPATDLQASIEQMMMDSATIGAQPLGFILMPDELAQDLDLPGVAVIGTVDNSAAARAGIIGTSRDTFGRPLLGDIILQVNGQKVHTSTELKQAFDQSSNNLEKELELIILRDDECVMVKLHRIRNG